MLVFINNTPRAYAWGSRDSLPTLLGITPTGEPQAELWLGDHPNAPASVAKATPVHHTLIDLIATDPERYGVDGGQLPFLFKVLGIGAPLSLQVHPNKKQAEEGFAREEAAGVPRDSPERNYGDPNHKPELLVALSKVSALCGFRPLEEVQADLQTLIDAAPDSVGRGALQYMLELCEGDDEAARFAVMDWALSGSNEPRTAVDAVRQAVAKPRKQLPGLRKRRVKALRALVEAYPNDPGVIITLLLHLVRLKPGEAVYLGAGQLHAYLCGIAVEVMAASDNVLRAGLTEKHVDPAELLHIVDLSTLPTPVLEARNPAPGMQIWQPDIPDFKLIRICLYSGREMTAHDIETPDEEERMLHCSESFILEAAYPLVMMVTKGRVRVDRLRDHTTESAVVARGQSLYVSAGMPVELTGHGEAFIATVGESWARVSQPSIVG